MCSGCGFDQVTSTRSASGTQSASSTVELAVYGYTSRFTDCVARASAISASDSRLMPQLRRPLHLWCEITTGRPASRPMRRVSRTESSRPSFSLRMWVTYRPSRAAERCASAITSSVGALNAGGYARPVLSPMQPCSSAVSSAPPMASISPAVAARSKRSMTPQRSVVCPHSSATFTAGFAARTASAHSDTLAKRYHSRSPSRFIGGVGSRPASGARLTPQLPATTLVTPWLTLFSMSGPLSTARSSWVWASMKPGASTLPPASTWRSAPAGSTVPTTAMRSPSTATSAA